MEDHTEEVTQQARVLRDGHIYVTDEPSHKALAAVQRVDAHAADALFERWRNEGRIRPDVAADQRHYAGHHATDDQAQTQGHRR